MATKVKMEALDGTLCSVTTDHDKANAQYESFINGKWVKPKSGRYFDPINPANEQTLARIAEAGETLVDAAVQAASGIRTNKNTLHNPPGPIIPGAARTRFRQW